MRRFGASILGAALTLVTASALAQTPSSGMSGTVQAPLAPPPQAEPRPIPPSIGTIFGMPVRLWAPVEDPYNPHANGTGAASPLLANTPDWWSPSRD